LSLAVPSAKLFHTMHDDVDNKDKAFQFLCDMDGHSKKTGQKHYVCSNPKSDAKAAEAIYKRFGKGIGYHLW
jgi:hypothetical protein